MTRAAHAGVTFALAISLAACTVSDPGPELAATQQALDAIEQHALPGLKPLAQQERRSAMAARIATNEAVYSLGAGCFLVESGDLSGVHDCDLRPLDTLLEGPVNATQVVEAYRVLRDYQAALMRLANAATMAQARTASDGILAQFGKLATMLDPDSRAAANLAAAAPRVTGVLGLGLDQYRIAALSHAVRGADSAVREISGLALDWYLDRPGSPVALASDLRVANDRVFAARDAADPAAYTAAVAELEAQHAAYLAAWDASAARPFARYRTAHARLLNRLTDAAKPEDFTQPLQDLDAAFDN
ncbi:hypothetical protein [Pontivivens nitratireducens]|uniref:Uncharacterized protein n=1 Tax=Pontivivens nitratireducens TaxID=2758038 RepID=A0A6G7VQA5_9RHOB|nr:hypothetical protein [Pontibrevibacter nitratireducens]QIK42184.1 hypothetical protein G8E03_15115 [Pontibrevibacter nitratireducens]